jgi:hypothetical protein
VRVVKQKAIIKVIQPEIVEYHCDKCGKQCGTKDNPKENWHAGKKRKHYCKKTCSPRLKSLPVRLGPSSTSPEDGPFPCQ